MIWIKVFKTSNKLSQQLSYRPYYIKLSQIIRAIFYWSPEQQPHLFPGSPFHFFMWVLKLGREGACGDSVSSVRDCSGLRLLMSGCCLHSLALDTSAANRARVTHLPGTESYGRSVLTAGPSRMASGCRAPLGDCVHYWMSRLQLRENEQRNELKGVIYSCRTDGRIDGNIEEQSTYILPYWWLTTSKQTRNLLTAYCFHKAATRQCKTTGLEPAQDSFKIRGFFQKMTHHFYKVRDGCRSLINNASKAS